MKSGKWKMENGNGVERRESRKLTLELQRQAA
jgi:hypothetical protein